MKKMRTWFAADKTGFHMLHTLFQTSLKYTSVVRYDEWFVTRLLVDDGRVHGVVAIDLMSGRVEAITAGAVILCTGGCGRVFPFTTNASIKTGDGMALAYRAGAPLKDMEFVQYHPTGLPFTGILITEAARAEGGYLVNKDGYRYLQDYHLGTPQPKPVLRTMELGPRDRLSQAFMKELEKGRTIETPYGPVVHLDLRHLGREGHRRQDPVRARAVPEVPEPRSGEGPDSRPAGGALHDGRRAHRHRRRDAAAPGCTPPARWPASASTAPTASDRTRCPSCSSSARAPVTRPRSTRRGSDDVSRAASLRRRTTSGGGSRKRSSARPADASALPTFATRCRRRSKRAPASIARARALAAGGRHVCASLQERAADLAIEDHSRTFNTERLAALELTFMLDVAEAIVRSPRRDARSRAARISAPTFPARDDTRFLAHSLISRRPDGSCAVEYLPVRITRWPPAERVYGEAAAHAGSHNAAGVALSSGAGV